MKAISGLTKMIISSNQNNHRIDFLKDFNVLPEAAQADITALFESKGDRAHHAAGVLLWGFISHRRPVAILSCNDLDELIAMAGYKLPDHPFSVRNRTSGGSNVWKQLTGLLIKNEVIQILKKSSGRAPSVLEVIHPDWLKYIEKPASDELREEVLKSTESKAILQF